MRVFSYFFVISICLTILLSCSKSGQSGTGKFTWTYNGKTYEANQHEAHSRGFAPSSSYLMAIIRPSGPNTPSVGPRIDVEKLEQGTYTFGQGARNDLKYTDEDNSIHIAEAGSLNITKRTTNSVSGNFSVTLQNSKVLTGAFTNTIIKP